jgi:hypothetical protein
MQCDASKATSRYLRDRSMSMRARQQEEQSARRKKEVGQYWMEHYSPTHGTTVDPSSAYAGGCLDDSDRSVCVCVCVCVQYASAP